MRRMLVILCDGVSMSVLFIDDGGERDENSE